MVFLGKFTSIQTELFVKRVEFFFISGISPLQNTPNHNTGLERTVLAASRFLSNFRIVIQPTRLYCRERLK